MPKTKDYKKIQNAEIIEGQKHKTYEDVNRFYKYEKLIADNKKERKKRKRGPYKYKSEYCQAVIDFMGMGYSFDAFAGFIEVNRDTLFDWRKKYPEFQESVEIARNKNRRFWESVGIRGARDPKQISPAVWIFNMRNRFGWCDAIDGTGSQNKTISLNYNLQTLAPPPNNNNNKDK